MEELIKFFGTLIDTRGNAILGARVEVFEHDPAAPFSTLAVIYDSTGSVVDQATDPIHTSDTGLYEFYVISDIYDIRLSPIGLEVITNIGVTVGAGDVFRGYSEPRIAPDWVLEGAIDVIELEHSAKSTANRVRLPSMTRASRVRFIGPLKDGKPITLETIPDTGGPWPLEIEVAGGVPVPVERNGGGSAPLELFDILCDGESLFPLAGLVMPDGATGP